MRQWHFGFPSPVHISVLDTFCFQLGLIGVLDSCVFQRCSSLDPPNWLKFSFGRLRAWRCFPGGSSRRVPRPSETLRTDALLARSDLCAELNAWRPPEHAHAFHKGEISCCDDGSSDMKSQFVKKIIRNCAHSWLRYGHIAPSTKISFPGWRPQRSIRERDSYIKFFVLADKGETFLAFCFWIWNNLKLFNGIFISVLCIVGFFSAILLTMCCYWHVQLLEDDVFCEPAQKLSEHQPKKHMPSHSAAKDFSFINTIRIWQMNFLEKEKKLKNYQRWCCFCLKQVSADTKKVAEIVLMFLWHLSPFPK